MSGSSYDYNTMDEVPRDPKIPLFDGSDGCLLAVSFGVFSGLVGFLFGGWIVAVLSGIVGLMLGDSFHQWLKNDASPTLRKTIYVIIYSPVVILAVGGGLLFGYAVWRVIWEIAKELNLTLPWTIIQVLIVIAFLWILIENWLEDKKHGKDQH